MTPDEPARITISRDALRADLAEMELRLRTWIGSQLEQKANVADLERLVARMDAHEDNIRVFARGDFTDAQKRAFNSLIDENLKEHTDTGWTMRQRYLAVAALLVSIVAVVSSIYLAVHFAH